MTDKPLILVTGASGLIGDRLVHDLARDHRVAALDVKPPPRPLPAGARFTECDLTRVNSVMQAVQEIRQHGGEWIASVVHLAAYYDFSGEPSPLYDELTIEGTRRLLKSLRLFRQVEQFVFSSSILVHRPAEKGHPIDESSPLAPQWDYPKSKVAAERVIREERGEVPVVILRIAGVYDEEGHSLPLTRHIRRVYEKKLESVFFPGDVTHGQAYVHLADLIDGFRRTIESRDRLGAYEVFVMAEPDVMSYEELQDKIGTRLHGHEWPTIHIPAPLAKVGAWLKDKAPTKEEPFIKPWMVDLADAHYPVSIAKAERLLDWRPRHRLRDTLDAMLDHLVQDPRAFYETNQLPTESLSR